MTMWRVLLAKDLRRTLRNPLPVLINLALPLCVAGLVGLAFGGKSDGGALGRIRFALVDEDKTLLSDFLRGAAHQREGGKHLEPVLLERDEAMRQINDNRISAVLVIPTNFTRHYFSGRESVSLELIKNPAQSIHPAVMEELLGALVTAMNAVSRNLQSEFPDWQAVLEGRRDYREIAGLIERAGDKLKQAEQFINPPLVVYETESIVDPERRDDAPTAISRSDARKRSPGSEVFGFLLPGMAGMFLLFLASNAMTDLPRELRQRTLARYHTLHHRLAPFIAAKVIFTVVVLLLCSVILLTGGGLLFGIDWRSPGPLALLTVGYAGFAAGLVAVLVALVPDERKASALNTVVAMGLALAGGCMFPPQALPVFLGKYISPLLATHWFVDTARNLQAGGGEVGWGFALVKLLAVSAVLLGVAALLFRRQLRTGVSA